MDAVLVALALALAVGVGVAIAWPLARGTETVEDAGPADRLERLEDQLEASLRAIREIEQDHMAGGLSDEDFETLNRDERTRAVELMRRIDRLRPASTGSDAAEPIPPSTDPPLDQPPKTEGEPGAERGAPTAERGGERSD